MENRTTTKSSLYTLPSSSIQRERPARLVSHVNCDLHRTKSRFTERRDIEGSMNRDLPHALQLGGPVASKMARPKRIEFGGHSVQFGTVRSIEMLGQVSLFGLFFCLVLSTTETTSHALERTGERSIYRRRWLRALRSTLRSKMLLGFER